MIIKTGFCGHAKVRDLRLILEEPLAEVYLVRIWDRAQGARRWVWRVDEAARELALWAEFQGPPERLYRALVRAGWLDQEGSEVRLHDWEEHQGQFLQRLEASAKGARRRRELAAERRNGVRTGFRPDERTGSRPVTRTGAIYDPSGLPSGCPDGCPDGNPVLGIGYSPTENPPLTPPAGGSGVEGEGMGISEEARELGVVFAGVYEGIRHRPLAPTIRPWADLLCHRALCAGMDGGMMRGGLEWLAGHHGGQGVPRMRNPNELRPEWFEAVWDARGRAVEEGAGMAGDGDGEVELGEDVRIGARALEILGGAGR